MGYKIETPTELWSNYDPSAEPLKAEAIFENVEVNRARAVKDCVFTAETLPDGEVKVFCRVVAPISRRGFVVLIEDYAPRDNQKLIDTLAEAGLAVFVPDYADRMNSGTKFPPSAAYGKLSVGRERLFRMREEPRDTCQYLYEKILKRTITFANTLFPGERCLALGAGLAAELAVSVAGSDRRVAGLVLLNGGIYREYLMRNRFSEAGNETMDDHTVSWMSGVASAAYAKSVLCPTFFLACTNSDRFDADRLQTMLQLLKNSEVRVYLTPGGTETVGNEGYAALLGWLNGLLDGAPKRNGPEAKIRYEDGAYSVYVRADPSEKPVSVDVYTAFNEYDHRFRSWRKTRAKSISDQSEYLAAVDAEGYETALFAFAEVKYASGAAYSSIVLYSDEKPETRSAERARLVLTGREGAEFFRAETEEEILSEASPIAVATPVGLSGVTAERGALVTFLLNSKRKIDADAVLQIDFYTEKAREVSLRAVAVEDGKAEVYRATAELKGASGSFSAARFAPETFKNAEMMPLESWIPVKSLYIEPKGAAVGNILFV